METWPEAHRYRGSKCALFQSANLGGTAEGHCLSSQWIGAGGLFLSQISDLEIFL